jgi:hypothetical protein
MNETTKSFNVCFKNMSKGTKKLEQAADKKQPEVKAKVCRLSRLMALAIHFDKLLGQAAVSNQAQLAELGYVSRARVTQIMNLNLLAPDIQEQILFLQAPQRGRDPYPERKIRHITQELDWDKQRDLWQKMLSNAQ